MSCGADSGWNTYAVVAGNVNDMSPQWAAPPAAPACAATTLIPAVGTCALTGGFSAEQHFQVDLGALNTVEYLSVPSFGTSDAPHFCSITSSELQDETGAVLLTSSA